MEKRRFHRISLSAKCELRRDDRVYPGQVQNISLNGALVNFRESALSFIRPGVRCSLDIHVDEGGTPLTFGVEITHTGFSFGGMMFTSYVHGLGCERHRLVALIDARSAAHEWLANELELARKLRP